MRYGRDEYRRLQDEVDRRIKLAGRTGSKMSAARIAEKAGVSPEFVNQLAGRARSHETTKMVEVLRVIGTTLDEVHEAAGIRK